MSDIAFIVASAWHYDHGIGVGELNTGDRRLAFGAPEGMGGAAHGSNPEVLFAGTICACYTATLAAILVRAGLPHEGLAVQAEGRVTGFPARARFAGVTVHPSVLGADSRRRDEYRDAATTALRACLVGEALSVDVFYALGDLELTAQRQTVLSGEEP